MRSERPEWTVAGGDPLFIGMQNNGQWSVMWGVVGTDSGTVLCFFFISWLVEAAESTFNGALDHNTPVTSHLLLLIYTHILTE